MDDAADIFVSCPMGLSKIPDVRSVVIFYGGGNRGDSIANPHGFLVF